MSDPGSVAVREAATVMLLRDGDEGLEVFMLRRSLESVFVAGAYVFPGGAVDDHDRAPEIERVCEGRTDASASAALGVERGGLAYWVAAIRECFEEAGVLLAYDAAGDVVRLDDPSLAARFAAHRQAVDSGRRRLTDVCAEEGLRLAVDGMRYFAHWITPLGPPRRYDTRFFVVAAPPEQEPLHDDRETVANEWVRPADALERFRRGTYELIEPTERTLTALARFDTAHDVLAAAAAHDGDHLDAVRMTPDGGGLRILLPGDDALGDVRGCA